VTSLADDIAPYGGAAKARPRRTAGGRLRGLFGSGRYRDSYSLLVRFLKVALPVSALGLVVLVALWPELSGTKQRIEANLPKIERDDGGLVTMLDARLTGLDDDNQRFNLRAAAATRIPEREDLVELDLPDGDLLLSDGTWLALTANSGLMDRTAETVDLMGDVNLFHDEGHEFITTNAQVDMASGRAHGVAPVKGQSPMGAMRSQGFEVSDNGDVIRFTGKAWMLIKQGALAGAETREAGQ